MRQPGGYDSPTDLSQFVQVGESLFHPNLFVCADTSPAPDQDESEQVLSCHNPVVDFTVLLGINAFKVCFIYADHHLSPRPLRVTIWELSVMRERKRIQQHQASSNVSV